MTFLGALVAGGLGVLAARVYVSLTEDAAPSADPGTRGLEPVSTGDSDSPPLGSDSIRDREAVDIDESEPPPASDAAPDSEPQTTTSTPRSAWTEVASMPKPLAYEATGVEQEGVEPDAEDDPVASAEGDSDERPPVVQAERVDAGDAPAKVHRSGLGRHPLLVLIVGLIGLAALCFFSLRYLAPRIEADLTTRAQQQLTEAGIDASILVLDGRDAILTGVLASEDEKSRAESLVAGVHGVRTVRSRLKTRPSAPPAEPQEQQEPEKRLDLVVFDRQLEFEPYTTDKLTPEGEAALDKIVEMLHRHPSVRIEISGHTDNSGNADDNLALSELRAQSVTDYLVDSGLAADRFETVGYGGSRPAVDNSTPEGRQKNRRVEFRLLEEQE